MSDHHGCQFVLFPVGGPMRTVNAHPTPEAVGDALGGAYASPIIAPAGNVVAWVRETCVEEDQPRNVMAALALQILSRAPTPPILGPCVITQMAWSVGPTMPVGAPEGFGPDLVKGIRTMMTDLSIALAGGPLDGVSDPVLDEGWAEAVRQAAERLSTAALPDGYPAAGFRRVPELPPPWRGLARHFADGRTYAEFPAG